MYLLLVWIGEAIVIEGSDVARNRFLERYGRGLVECRFQPDNVVDESDQWLL